ncbi:MAG: hypothetical protein FJZ80_07695 [Bacteroidetes bacterium]|nr:hypothetical protein [Bacteroidota bacterium]
MASKVFIIGFFCCWAFAYSQKNTPTVDKIILLNGKEQVIDSLSILPGSLNCYLKEVEVPRENYAFDYVTSTLKFYAPTFDTLRITYVRINQKLTPSYQKFDVSSIQQRGQSNNFQLQADNTDFNNFFGSSEIAKKGSVSRGISFGNQQNLGINSTLNLELNGKLNDRLNILASISDANIPIQPEGNTNRLQEFDQVFIQLYNEKLKFVAGDFWLAKPQGYFLNYRKRGQGITHQYQTTFGKGVVYFQTSAGLSKGKFQRQIISGVENNQGPYRLRGAENEPFIIVLSGTEKIFLDGRLLVRGQEFDYTIDYNTSELVFTPKNLITKDVRIVAEFQYSDQSYTRSLLQQSITYKTENTWVYLNYYREQDLKNQPLQLSLTSANKTTLSQVGDSLSLATLNTLDSVGYFANQNLYKLIDSLGFDSILVFTVHPDSARYRATFTKVGAFKGNYVLDKTTAFGPVYRWVEPVGNQPQGDYAPLQRIITPKRRSMITVGIEQKIGQKFTLVQEISGSENATNLFSKKDLGNDWGIGSLTKIGRQWNETSKGWINKSSGELEFLSATFSAIEPYRKVEFDRDWNVRGLPFTGNQWFAVAQHVCQHEKIGTVSLRGQHFNIGNNYQAQRLFSEGSLKGTRLRADWDASALNSLRGKQNTFIRHRANIEFRGKKLLIGFKDDQELNLRDTLTGGNSSSYGFFDYQFYFENADSSKNKLRLFLRDRLDYKPTVLGIATAARGTSLGGETVVETKKGNRFLSTIAWRKLTPIDTALLKLTPDQSLVGRLEYSGRSFKGALVLNSYYELNTGLEQKRTFIYLEVNAGQGTHTWIDYNNDGVKDLNEFELAAYVDQANYIRVFTPSDEYQKTFGTEFNQSLFWRPELIWNKKTGILKVLSLLSNQFRLRSARKFNDWKMEELLNPLRAEISNADLISSTYSLRNTLFLLRTSSKFNAHYEFNKALNKTLLATGFDGKSVTFHSILARWNILPSLSVKTEIQSGLKSSEVDYTTGRNYQISYRQGLIELAYQPTTSYRIYGEVKLNDKRNNPVYGVSELQGKELSAGVKYNTAQKGSLQLDIKYLNLKYVGINQGAVVFEMLETLQPGSNFTWSVLWQRNVSKNLQVNLQYSGRKPANRGVIHNGGMELRAFF